MADELNGLVPVAGKYIRPAAATLAKAFQDYPVSAFFEPDAARRKKRQPGVFRMVLRSALVYGEVYAASPAMEGVAVWMLVDKRQKPRKRGLSIGKWFAGIFQDREQREKQQAFFNYSHNVRDRIMPERYWYLQILGVDPAYQGKGYADRLLKPMLARADREGLPVFLETQEEKNVALYEHFGFTVVEEGMIPGSGVKSWAMVRGNKR